MSIERGTPKNLCSFYSHSQSSFAVKKKKTKGTACLWVGKIKSCTKTKSKLKGKISEKNTGFFQVMLGTRAGKAS